MTPAEKLAEAEAAHHALQTGAQVASVTSQAGERVEYNRSALPRLAAYIADLKRQAAGRTRRRTFNPTPSKGL